MNENCLVIPYPKGNKKDVKITYLSPNFAKKFSYGEQDLLKGKISLKVITEELGDLLSLRRCSMYLHFMFPDEDFSDNNIKRCFEIILIVLNKASHVEQMDTNILDCCYNYWFINHGVMTDKRKDILDLIFSNKTINIPLYNVDEQVNNDWIQTTELSFEEKLSYISSNDNNPDQDQSHLKYMTFTLKEMLECDQAYNLFIERWSKFPSHQEVRDALISAFPPNSYIDQNLINYIFSKLTNETK